MIKDNYLDLLSKIEEFNIKGFNDTTSDFFIKFFLKLTVGVMIFLALLMVCLIGLLFFNTEYSQSVLRGFNYTSQFFLPVSIGFAIVSIRNKNGKSIWIHKWLYKKYILNFLNKQKKNGYISSEQFNVSKEIIENYPFDESLNNISFSEILIFNILKKIKDEKICNVSHLGDFEKRDYVLNNMKNILKFWKTKRFIAYWNACIYQNNKKYDKYKAELYVVDDSVFLVYENDKLNDVIKDIKNILATTSDSKNAKEQMSVILRKMELETNLTEKEDIPRVRKKI